MCIKTFDFEEERLKDEITKRGAIRVLIQLPEGLKTEGPRLAAIVEGVGALAIVSADPCYGACDLAIPDAKSLAVDLIVHYGHSEMIKQEAVPTIYIEVRAKVDVRGAVRKTIPYIKHFKNVGLVTTVQHVHVLDKAGAVLLEGGKTVVIGDAGRVKHPGQVIGCDYSTAKSISNSVEAFIFVGGGRFHAYGVALATGKPTIVADPYEKRAYSIDKEVKRILRQRWASICVGRQAETYGVLIGLKSGQKRLNEAIQVKEKLEKVGKKTTLLALREITPETLMQFHGLQAFVNTACPRLSLDEPKFLKPVLTPNEVFVMLGEMGWEELYRTGWL